MPRKPPFGGSGPKSGNPHTDLVGAVRRSPAALPIVLAEQPATTGDGRAEALSNLLRRSARKTADWRRYADTVAQSNKEAASAARRMLDERQQEIEQLRARLLHLSEEQAARQSADRDIETAEPELVMGTKPDGSPWVVSAEFVGSDVRVDGYGALRLHGKAIAPAAAHKLATGLLAAIAWLENDGAAKAESAASPRGEQP